MHSRLVLLRALHPFPSFLVALVTVGLVPLADRSAPVGRYVVLGLGMLCFQFAIGLVNDVIDAADDRKWKPRKPLAQQPTTVWATGAAVVFGASGLLLTASTLSMNAGLLGLGGLGCGLGYDLYFKRTQYSWLPYAVAMPLVPAWVYVASDAWRPLLWWTFPLGAAFGFALHLANQAPDIDTGGQSGLPGRLGARRSRLLAVAVFAVGVCIALAVLAIDAPGRGLTIATLGAAAIAGSPYSTRLFGREGLFGLLAVAAACMALLFVSAA